ncbi:MAG: signal peptidase I [Solirubrobacteraceae bacterium]
MKLIKLVRGNQVVEFVVIVALALALAYAIQAVVVKPYRIPTQSMEPTLIPGQRVLVDRLGNDFFGPSIGDIVVFHPPVAAEGPGNGSCGAVQLVGAACSRPVDKEASVNYIKRVVAVGGDTIAIINGHVILNGKRQKEPFANFNGCATDPNCTYRTPIKVPAGYYYMMGDNRSDSEDSRFWGPVPRAWIIGEAFATYWPPDRIGFL